MHGAPWGRPRPDTWLRLEAPEEVGGEGAGGQGERGKGAFQELDQVQAARQFCKLSCQARSAAEVPALVARAAQVRPPSPAFTQDPGLFLICCGAAQGSCTAAPSHSRHLRALGLKRTRFVAEIVGCMSSSSCGSSQMSG